MKEKTFTLTSDKSKGVLTLLGWLPTASNPSLNITDSIATLKYILTYGKYNISQQELLNNLRAQYYSDIKKEEIITW